MTKILDPEALEEAYYDARAEAFTKYADFLGTFFDHGKSVDTDEEVMAAIRRYGELATFFNPVFNSKVSNDEVNRNSGAEPALQNSGP